MSENSDSLGSPRPEPLGGDDGAPAAAAAAPVPASATTPAAASAPPEPASGNAFWGDDPVAATAAPQGEQLTFSTTVRARDFLAISLINGLLNIITLTLYRFWGKTEVRRRVWRGLRVNGEALEYTGRGVELFIGFLLAVVLLGLPFLGFVFAVQFLDPLYYGLLFPLYLVLFWLFGFGMFTAFRYMASRTTWRGVRFALAGSAQTYGWTWLGMQIATGFTLGWIQPVFERMLAQQVWDHMRFGDRRFRWNQAASERIGLYGPFAVGWFLTALFVVGLFVTPLILAASDLSLQTQGYTAPSLPEPPEWAYSLFGYLVLVVLAPIFALFWAPYQSALLRSVAAGISLDEARFALKVGSLSLWWLTVTNLLLVFVSFGILMPLVQARTAKYLVRRLTSTGTAQIEAARQTGSGPRTAEGLADAFGFSFI